MAIIKENVLWASVDKLRGSVAPSDYMHITLGLIFQKYISNRFEEKYKALVKDGEGFEMIKMNIWLIIYWGFLKNQDGNM